MNDDRGGSTFSNLVGAFINMLVSALFTMLVTYIIEKLHRSIFNMFHKRKFCFVCGGTGYTKHTDDDGIEIKTPCKICNQKKKR